MLKLRIPYAKLIERGIDIGNLNEQDIKKKLMDMLDIVDCDFGLPLKLTDYPDTEEVGIEQEGVNMSVLGRIDEAIEYAQKEIDTVNNRIENLKKKREYLLSLTDVCPSCDGRGQERYTDAAGSGDWRECLTCRGLGKIGPIECECGKIIGVDMVRVRRETFPRCPWCGASLGGQYRISF